jgi:hypothetical protein
MKNKLNSEMIWEKGKLNSDKTWTIWKKSRLNCEMIWKIQKKSKSNMIRYGKKAS